MWGLGLELRPLGLSIVVSFRGAVGGGRVVYVGGVLEASCGDPFCVKTNGVAVGVAGVLRGWWGYVVGCEGRGGVCVEGCLGFVGRGERVEVVVNEGGEFRRNRIERLPSLMLPYYEFFDHYQQEKEKTKQKHRGFAF